MSSTTPYPNELRLMFKYIEPIPIYELFVPNTPNCTGLNSNYVIRKLQLNFAVIRQKFGAHFAHSRIRHNNVDLNL